MDKIQFFCIPFAGGSAMIYNKWMPLLDESIQLYPLELSGRGTRMHEPLYQQMAEAVDDLLTQFLITYQGGRFAIFGHSLGGTLAFELAHKLIEKIEQKPEHIFFSGTRPPQKKLTDEILHTKNDEEFIKSIFKLGGTPLALLQDKQLLDFFIPIIKSDYRLFELYQYASKAQKLPCPITIFLGDDDFITTPDDADLWALHTVSAFKQIVLAQSGHFFVEDKYQQVIEHVNALII